LGQRHRGVGNLRRGDVGRGRGPPRADSGRGVQGAGRPGRNEQRRVQPAVDELGGSDGPGPSRERRELPLPHCPSAPPGVLVLLRVGGHPANGAWRDHRAHPRGVGGRDQRGHGSSLTRIRTGVQARSRPGFRARCRRRRSQRPRREEAGVMAEAITEMIIPATYIEVRAEGLIGVSGIATGNVGVVGTASKGPVGAVQILSSFSDARDLFGSPDPWGGGTQNELTLVRALQQAFANGASTVYAVRCAAGGGAKGFLALPKSTGPVVTLTAKTPGTWAGDVT